MVGGDTPLSPLPGGMIGSKSQLTTILMTILIIYVSMHAHVGRLRLSVVNMWDAFCVLFRTFFFGKVQIVSCSIHEMHFMVFGFYSVAHCMLMSHGYFHFPSFTKLYDRSVFAGRK